MEPDASLTSSKTPPSGRKIKSHQMSVVRWFGAKLNGIFDGVL